MDFTRLLDAVHRLLHKYREASVAQLKRFFLYWWCLDSKIDSGDFIRGVCRVDLGCSKMTSSKPTTQKNQMILLYAALLGLLPALEFCDRGRLSTRGFAVKWMLLSIFSGLFYYIDLPALSAYGIGEGSWCLLVVLLVGNVVWHFMTDGKPGVPVLLALLVGLFLGVFELSSWPIFRAGDLSSNIGAVERKEWNQSMAPVDPKHIRLVSAEQAEWIGAKALGDGLGSVYHPGRYSLQKIGDRLYWVAALDFQGFRRWMSANSAPGAIVVDAHDPTTPARLVQKDASGKELKLRFTPKAFFGKNLERHVYMSGYSRYELQGWHLEFDDEYRPFWIVTALKPTIGFSGEKPAKVLTVDPETGAVTEYALDTAPVWIDRVIPEQVAVNNLTWWGRYRKGWWASFVGAQNLLEPSALNKEAAWLVYGQDGRCYWYAGLTSISDRDDTLLGYTLTDTRSGKTTEYHVSGTTAGTANAAVSAAAAKVSNFRGYHPTQPIPYNIYGHLAYVVPIVNENHLFQRVAIVDVTCQKVALGEDKSSALLEFKQLLSGASGNGASPTLDASSKTFTFKVERASESVRNGNSTVYLYTSQQPGRTFFGTAQQGHQLFLTQEGDVVTIKFLDTEESLIPIQELTNPSLNKR